MRLLACVLMGLTLVGCGQSGALQLTNDAHLDKRPKYLLWHNKNQDNQSTNSQNQ